MVTTRARVPSPSPIENLELPAHLETNGRQMQEVGTTAAHVEPGAAGCAKVCTRSNVGGKQLLWTLMSMRLEWYVL